MTKTALYFITAQVCVIAQENKIDVRAYERISGMPGLLFVNTSVR